MQLQQTSNCNENFHAYRPMSSILQNTEYTTPRTFVTLAQERNICWIL